MGRTLGIILLIGGTLVALVIGWLMMTMRGEGSTTGSGAVLGFALAFLVLVLPQWGIGAYLFWKGGQEATVQETREKQRELLDIIKSRGQIDIGDAAIELQVSKDEVQDMLHQLVGMGLYTGYINWDEGVLYSKEASQIRELTKCYHCGGEVKFAGKGVLRCPYCGTEYFL
ncbi:MAG: PCI domain-containing protein [Candidatus Promineifilaceae bacterium]|jgi:hypothetical protein